MSTKTELKLLASRRAVLAAQSDLNRELLQSDLRQLRARIEEISGKVVTLRKFSGIFSGVCALAGCLLRKKEGAVTKIVRSMAALLPLLRLLKSFRAGTDRHGLSRQTASGQGGPSLAAVA